MSHWSTSTVVFAATLVFGFDVHADCLGPEQTLSFSFPADGDTSVPVNAKIFVLPEAADVTVDGVALRTIDGVVWDPGPLEPAATHIVDIGILGGGLAVVGSSITFTTGTDVAPALDPATVDVVRFDEATVEDRTCAQPVPYDCIDDAPHYRMRLGMASTSAVAWFTSAGGLWSGCDAAFADVIDFGGGDEACYTATAFGADGSSVSAEVCEPSPACAIDGICGPPAEGEGAPAPDSSDGCSSSPPGCGFGLIAVLAWRRRRFGAQAIKGSRMASPARSA
jgi:hypothetical protein